MDIIRVIAAGIPGKENKGWSPLSVWREIQTTGGECLCLSDIDCIQKVEKGRVLFARMVLVGRKHEYA